MPSRLKPYEEDDVVKWIELMKDRLDRYEVERNEFTADYRMVPKNVMFYREVLLPFAENTLIMDNIAASEGVRYKNCGCENNLRIRCFINGNEIKAKYPNLKGRVNNKCDTHDIEGRTIIYPDLYPYLLEPDRGNTLEDEIKTPKIIPESVDDIEICLPSEHAFYSILENVIRNSAKHNKKELQKKDKPLEICVSINEDKENKNLYQIDIYDNVSAITIEDLKHIISGKRDSILNEDGQLRRENLGIADMKINAHLLRSAKEVEDDILNEHLEITLLKPLKKNTENGCKSYCGEGELFSLKNLEFNSENGRRSIKTLIDNIENQDHNDKNEPTYRFGYRFHLAKSKKICWIGKEINNREVLNKFNNQGIYFFENKEEFDKPENGSLAAYQFAILELNSFGRYNDPKISGKKREAAIQELEELLIQLPFRVLLNIRNAQLKSGSILYELTVNDRKSRIQKVDCAIDIPKHPSENTSFNLLKACWENWLRRWVKDEEKVTLTLSFEVGDDGNLHESWKKLLNKDGSNSIKLTDKLNLHFRLTYPKGNLTTEELLAERVIMYDHHGQNKSKLATANVADGNFLTRLFNSGFYQAFEKNSDDYVPLNYPPKGENKKKLFCYELIEAGLCNVMVVDERLCANIFKKVDTVQLILFEKTILTFGQLNSWANLWLANKFEENVFIEDDMNNHKKFTSKIEEATPSATYWESELESLHIDGIILHRTYLGKKYIESDSKSYLHNLKNEVPFVTLVSGGGYPHGLSGKFKFKPFNTFQPFFSTSISKYNIIQRLMI